MVKRELLAHAARGDLARCPPSEGQVGMSVRMHVCMCACVATSRAVYTMGSRRSASEGIKAIVSEQREDAWVDEGRGGEMRGDEGTSRMRGGEGTAVGRVGQGSGLATKAAHAHACMHTCIPRRHEKARESGVVRQPMQKVSGMR